MRIKVQDRDRDKERDKDKEEQTGLTQKFQVIERTGHVTWAFFSFAFVSVPIAIWLLFFPNPRHHQQQQHAAPPDARDKVGRDNWCMCVLHVDFSLTGAGGAHNTFNTYCTSLIGAHTLSLFATKSLMFYFFCLFFACFRHLL